MCKSSGRGWSTEKKVDKKMASVDGEMFCFHEENKNLLAFVSQRKCSHAFVLLGGLGDGFMSLSYTSYLSSELRELDFSLVQVNLSSSFNQFGFSSLQQDCKELCWLVSAIKDRYHFQSIVLSGHSTGNQDLLYLLRHGNPDITKHVTAIVLQGAVSDRDVMETFEETLRMTKEASALVEQGKQMQFLSDRLYDAPVTAERFLSLVGRLTPDDMFSVDLTEEELTPILAVKVPILMCFSKEDEYVPKPDQQRELTDRMVNVLKKQGVAVECVYLAGDHGLTKKQFYQPFVEQVCNFLQKNILSKLPA